MAHWSGGVDVKEEYQGFTLSPQGHKHTRLPDGEADRWQSSGRPQKQHSAVRPRGFESTCGQHIETGNKRTGRDRDVPVHANLSVVSSRIQSPSARKVSAICKQDGD